MFEELISASTMTALFQVIMIDLVLAGDNAIVIGLAAAGLPAAQRGKVIFIGIAAATVLRIVLALLTTQLLAIVGLLLAGGVLLLWVSWKMWRELHHSAHAEDDATNALAGRSGDHADLPGAGAPRKTFKQAAWQIVVADLSMSLDNVLAVGGAAREHPWVLVFGLALSIALMAIAASYIARLLQRHRWIGFVGLAVIVYVSLEMMWRGWFEVLPHVTAALPSRIVATMGTGAWRWLLLAAVVGAVLALVARFAMRRQHQANS